MTDRTPITVYDIKNNNYSKNKYYILVEAPLDLTGGWNLPFTKADLIKSLDINILIEGFLRISYILNLESISKNIIVKDKIIINDCPKLKNIPIEVTTNKNLFLHNPQQFITILSEEQFSLLKSFNIRRLFRDEFVDQKINSYEEYYSLIEPTLKKNNIFNSITF